jgi:hypothetical protein
MGDDAMMVEIRVAMALEIHDREAHLKDNADFGTQSYFCGDHRVTAERK